MMGKTKEILKVILILFALFAIIYSLIAWIISLFTEPDVISSDEVQLYVIDSNLVTNYQTYYYIESCFENLVEGSKQGKIEELYKLYIGDYKKQYTKEEVYAKLSRFSIASTECKLQKVYYTEDIYILEYKINESTEYLFMQLGTSKSESYNFAFVK